ncbi:MAG: L,D-transpeptidase family protein [Pseudomonadota bacterium]
MTADAALTVTEDGRLVFPGGSVRCALGPAGVSLSKREGDGATPAGRFALRRALYRPDRGPAPQTRLPVEPIAENDGWCDAPGDPAYNRPVTLPYPASAEHLWRADNVYDIIIVLGHNDDPPEPGCGSAIFFHLAHDDYRPTEGCVAVSRKDMEAILKACGPGSVMEIRKGDAAA